MKRFNKMTALVLVIAILLCAVPFTPLTVSADVAVNNSADKIATVEAASLTGTTKFTGGSANFSVNLTGVEAGIYKVAYYFSLGDLTANAQITLQPYGSDVTTVISYEDLQIYPNGKIAAVVVIRAAGDFTVAGSVTGINGTIDKIVVAKDSFDLGSAAELGLYVMYGEDIAQNVPDGYIQPGDTEWIQSIPMGLATTYNQQVGYVSNEGNAYGAVLTDLGVTYAYGHDATLSGKDYFEETWDALVVESKQIADPATVDGSGVPAISKPDNGAGNDDFLAYWSGTVAGGDGSSKYRINGLVVDNGVCIKIGGTIVYEYWGNGCWFDDGTAVPGTVEFVLPTTETTIEIYYIELGGGEGLNFEFQRYESETTGSGCNQETIWDWKLNTNVAISGFTATYWQSWGFVANKTPFEDVIIYGGGEQSHTFENNDWYDESIDAISEMVYPVTTIRKNTFVISSESDFRTDLTNLGFAMNGGDGPDGCFVTYTGYITADEDGVYEFGLTKVDNGCVVEIGDTRVIEYWGANTWWDNGGDSMYMDGVSVTMEAGVSLPISVTYLELGGGEGLTFVVRKDGGTEIDLTSSSLVFSTIPLKGVITENIPQLEDTNDRVLFHTDFTSDDNFTIHGSPALNTDKGIMIMNADDYIEMGIDMFQDVGLSTAIEFVVKPSAIVNNAAFAGIGTNDEQNWIVMGMLKDGALKYGMRTNDIEIGPNSSAKTEGGMLAVGTWTKVKYVFAETTVSIYVNDILKSVFDIAGQKDLSQLTGNFVFGKELKWNDAGFTGTVSEIRVTTTEQVLKIRDEETNRLLHSYTASDLAGSALQLETVEVDGYICNGWKDAEGNAVESATVGTTIYADLIAVNDPISTGRQLRVSADGTGGLRFRATIERDEFYNYFNEIDADYVYSEEATFKFGMLIIPADLLPDGQELVLETSKVKNIVGKKVYNQKNEYGDLEYTGVITNIPESQYGRLLLARPYVTYEYEGRTYTIYGEETAFGEYQAVARQVYADDEIDSDVKATLVAMFGEDALQVQDADLFAQNKSSAWVAYETGKNITSGIYWPEGQALPIFATPAETMDYIYIGDLTADEQIAFSALQGLMNKSQPRIHLLEFVTGKGNWINEATVGFTSRNTYTAANKYDMIAKYANEVDGVVLYSTTNSTHYRNLASTVAGLRNAIPVTQTVYDEMLNNGIDLPIVVDLTGLTYTSATDIYNYLYSTYWGECSKRLIVSAYPGDILTYVRDIAAATGAAVVYLDCENSTEQGVYEKFLKDMVDDGSTSIAMGWYTEERSGIGTGTKYGIGTVPADFYMCATTFGGTDHTIQQPEVPAKPTLENKVYIAMYISDGDNIQYNQGAMKDLWDSSSNVRGKVAINWTISPALVDVGPGLLNYYYANATDKDCFVCGPSGAGYAMMIDTSPTLGSTTYLKDSNTAYIHNYTKLSGVYLERSGLRVVTAWDNMSTLQRQYYEQNARYLYGATVHDWNGTSGVSASTVNDLRFEKHTICYGQKYSEFGNSIVSAINDWDGNSPLFLSYQISVWNNDDLSAEEKMTPCPARILDLYNELKAAYGDKFEFVRADHYFALYNEANNLNYNLCLDDTTTVTTSVSDDDASVLRDGSTYTMWTSKTRANEQYVQFDLGATHSISRYVIRFAGSRGMSTEYNVRAYHVEVSTDGSSWSTIDTYQENIADSVDVDLTATNARYVKFVIDDAEGDGYARIADIEIYGK